MLEVGALLFGDFTLKSGRKSPYFINTGEYGTGEQVSRLCDFYADIIKSSGQKFDVMYGPAYKGIPLAVMASSKFPGMRYAFNRKEAKDHGDGNTIMGCHVKKGDKVAIIEDVTTAGTSVRETISLFKQLDLDVSITSLYISVDRMEKGTGDLLATEQIKEDYGIKVYSIVTVNDIIGYLEAHDMKTYAAKMRDYLKI